MVQIVTSMPLTAIATVAGSAAIQLNVAKLRLGEQKQLVIGIREIVVDKDPLLTAGLSKKDLVLCRPFYEAN
jgi:hypothetical protein